MRRLLVVFAILIALAVLAAVLGVFLSGQPSPVLAGPRVLVWKIDSPLVDFHDLPSWSQFGRRDLMTSLADVHHVLEIVRGDDSIQGLTIYIHDTRFGFGKAQELRSLLRSLAAAGKFIDCYLETAGEGSNGTLAYYLATACQRITFSPLGEWNVVGLYSDSPFIRGTLDKLRIEPDFLHVGDYKSAAEFYTETEHSAAAEEALAAVLDDLFDQLVQGIATARELTPSVVRDLIDRAPLSADEALGNGLIDEVTYPDVFEGRAGDRSDTKPTLLPIENYAARARASQGHRVAVIFAQGTIIRGDNGTDPWSQQRFVGADTMRDILRPLAEDEDLAGVVLRVDSPGGSAVASDLILHELELLAAEKPVVVSMSDVAASGGYYISTRAAKIVADPATITGSIGVVGGKLATRRFQQELLGITHDALGRGANADIYSDLDPFTPAQREKFHAQMTRIYDVFVDHVVGGREMSRQEVEAIAGGRIWTGRQAAEIGLVDEIGGLDRAIELVLEMAGKDREAPTRLDLYPRPPSLFEILQRNLAPFLDLRSQPMLRLPLHRLPYALEVPTEVLMLFGVA